MTSQQQNNISIDKLSRFQKILLVTDGTVTKLLEHHLSESISVFKLNEIITTHTKKSQHTASDYLYGDPILEREILLQGQQTKTNWLYAKSTIFLNHLRKDFLTDLTGSNEPIGKLWGKYRLETYKSIISTGKEKADKLAKYFNIQLTDELISRTYNVYSDKKIIMTITEKFPTLYFCD